ncbi:MAG: type II secretion system F family protein [Vampirovibrio sp.]|nr:type II secretion system F family protein [Vampirovibrio sp.]
MPVFTYSAIDPETNKTITGKLEADNLRYAKEQIRNQGQIPTQLEEERDLGNLDSLAERIPILGDLISNQVSLKDVNIFTQQMHTLINAGVPLIESLYLLEQQSENKHFQKILKKVRSDVIAGDSFSDALSRFPKTFSRLYLNMIRSGEVSGELDKICERLSVLLDKQMELQEKIQGALMMPFFTALVIAAVTIFLLIFIVPTFSNMFGNFGAELPMPTLVLIAVSDFIINFWWALIIAIGTGLFWFNVFRTGNGKPFVDQWILTFPLIGTVLTKGYISSFIRTLATLVGSGVSLTEAIVTAAGTVDNYVMRVSFERARESLLVGGSLSKPLELSNTFPKMVVKMIAIGEETGELERMLNRSADFLDREVDAAVSALTKMIEPVMTIFLGGILLFILIALYMPYFEMSSVVLGK